jgi:ubiquinone/menaquinone biosynthesis C-methylase UbiE
MRKLLMRTFGRPQGVLGRLGGMIMARTNERCAGWVIDLLEIKPTDSVLEVGFGPGVGIQRLSGLAERVSGVDPSQEMVKQANARVVGAIRDGCVELRQGSVERLPFADGIFDKALAINSMHVWTDALAGLCEMRRVMKSGGTIALGFTPHSGQRNEGLTERLTDAGFVQAHMTSKDENFCAIAVKS